MKFKHGFTAISIGCLFLFASPSFACSCVPGITDEEHFKNAEHVLHVRIVGSEVRPTKEMPIAIRDEDFFGPEYVRVHYKLIETLKGNPDKVPFIRALVLRNGDCSTSLTTSLEYVVFLVSPGNFEMACSGSFALFNGENNYRLKTMQALAKKIKRH